MNYITTNIRLPEDDYLRLKHEAAEKRKSLSAVIREKVRAIGSIDEKNNIQKILSTLDRVASKNGKKLRNNNGVSIIRDLRDNTKW